MVEDLNDGRLELINCMLRMGTNWMTVEDLKWKYNNAKEECKPTLQKVHFSIQPCHSIKLCQHK